MRRNSPQALHALLSRRHTRHITAGLRQSDTSWPRRVRERKERCRSTCGVRRPLPPVTCLCFCPPLGVRWPMLLRSLASTPEFRVSFFQVRLFCSAAGAKLQWRRALADVTARRKGVQGSSQRTGSFALAPKARCPTVLLVTLYPNPLRQPQLHLRNPSRCSESHPVWFQGHVCSFAPVSATSCSTLPLPRLVALTRSVSQPSTGMLRCVDSSAPFELEG